MKIAQIIIAIIWLIQCATMLASDSQKQKPKEKTVGFLASAILATASFLVYYYAGAFSQLLK